MLRKSLLLLTLLVAPLTTYSASVANLNNATCSGVYSSSLQETALLSCSGNFTLSDGSIFSDSKITILADGALFLDKLQITAPAVEISSLQGAISIGSAVSINTNSFFAGVGSNTSPYINVSPGATLTIGSGNNVRNIDSGGISLAIGQGGATQLIGGPITLAPIPLPTASVLMLSGLLSLFGLKINKKKVWA